MHSAKFKIGFIIGCARSGTTWLGQVLGQSSQVRLTSELPVIFHLVDQIALMPGKRKMLGSKLVELYRAEVDKSLGQMYIDKSHQNIWLVEFLARNFSNACFIGIQRGVYATVASMLQHPGVLAHFHQWRKYPLPNFHIGLPLHLESIYAQLPLESKCALRWLAHRKRMEALRQLQHTPLHVLNYEALVMDYNTERQKLESFLGLQLGNTPYIKQASLAKWRNSLNTNQIKNIDHILESEDMDWIVQYFNNKAYN